MLNQYDLFISYATPNREVAMYIVEKMEKEGYRCFVAPRDIVGGADYASEIVRGISNATAVLLVFSSDSDKSGYVLREVNSAVSRGKTIIPMRIENFMPSEAMEFYLGATHWLDCFPDLLDTHLATLISKLKAIAEAEKSSAKLIKYKSPTIINYADGRNIDINYKMIAARTIELDYLCIDADKYIMNEEIEGRYEEWESSAKHYEEETSLLLVENDMIIGYTDIYPIIASEYQPLIDGKVIVRGSMIDMCQFGGEFDVYISMIAIDPEKESISNYMLIIDGILSHFARWVSQGIVPKNIGVSVYSDILEKVLLKMGFEYRSHNPAKGKVYEVTYDKLMSLPYCQKRKI